MTSAYYILDGLNCANCARKIEERAKKLDGVSDVTLNFSIQQLKIVYESSKIPADKLSKELDELVRKLEPEVIVRAGNNSSDKAVNSDEIPALLRISFFSSITGAVIYFAAILAGFAGFYDSGSDMLRFWLFFAAYILLGWDVVMTAVKRLLSGELFDENFLMSISTAGAFFIGEYPEGVAVMLFYKVGEYFQNKAVGKSRKSIKSLMNLKPEYAGIPTESGGIRRVDPSEVAAGSVIIVLPGEKIPLDGIIVEGIAQLDNSSLTGESVLVSVSEGSEVLSGALNLDGRLKLKTTKTYSDSTVAKILELVENASSRKAPAEKFVTRFSKIYTPAVVAFAVLLTVLPTVFVPGAVLADWLKRALVFLVVSCPCALVISIPLSFFSGIGAASKKGILIKGGNYLQALSEINTMVFDKTGTLTKGGFEVEKLLPGQGVSETELISLAYSIEKYSNHPAAKSITTEFDRRGLAYSVECDGIKEIPGRGLSAELDGRTLYCGNETLMKSADIAHPAYGGNGSVVHVAYDKKYMGSIVMSDKVKKDAKNAVESLHELGVGKIAMLTGDRRSAAEQTAKETGIMEFYPELLPHEKVTVLEKMYSDNPSAKIAFAGDGINDAPVLARSDIGIAMGGLGSDAAIEAADVIIMNDEPSKIAEAVKLSRFTMKIVKQNIALALAVKFAVMLLSAFGLAVLWLAVFADVGVALLVVLNSMRIR